MQKQHLFWYNEGGMCTKEIVNLLSSKLQELSHDIIASVLFGSWARGEAKEGSDIDLLIVSDNVHRKRQKRSQDILRIKKELALPLPLDILLVTQEECLENFRSHNPLFLDIACDGIILFDPKGFLRTLFEETRAYIQEKGLVRLPDGWRFPARYREATPLSQVTNKDFARAMLCDGQRDFVSGKILAQEGYFDKAVYHFQQAVEKATKSILIAFGVFRKSHFVSQDLRDIAKKADIDATWREKLLAMADIGEEIEPEVTLSRYPALDAGRLWIPSEEYTHEDAEKTQRQAETALEIAKNFFLFWFQEPP